MFLASSCVFKSVFWDRSGINICLRTLCHMFTCWTPESYIAMSMPRAAAQLKDGPGPVHVRVRITSRPNIFSGLS
jgi:hypothetical protein